MSRRFENGISGSVVWSALRCIRVTASNALAGSFPGVDAPPTTFTRTADHCDELHEVIKLAAIYMFNVILNM